jgi:hypothetical protein
VDEYKAQFVDVNRLKKEIDDYMQGYEQKKAEVGLEISIAEENKQITTLNFDSKINWTRKKQMSQTRMVG